LELKKEEARKLIVTTTLQFSCPKILFHGRSKHIGVRFHFLRDLVNDGVVKLSFCIKLEQFVKLLGMLGVIDAAEI